MRKARLAATTAFTVIAIAISTSSAQAQEADSSSSNTLPGASEAAQEPATDGADIVVTGSRIARRDYVANSPISTIGTADFERTGSVTPETALVQLPQFTASTGSTTNSNSNGGQANIQLRGLGRQRTLVLLDGRRLPPANPDGSVDINLLPSSLIETVEVITGGASAVYGSDAVAGVVNFKLRKAIDGIEIDAQNGISDKGDAGDRKISIAAGKKFDGGRGNVILAGEYGERDSIFVSDRDYTFGANRDSISPFGAVSFASTNRPSQAALNAVFSRYGIAAGTVTPANSIGFNTDGTLYSSGVAVANYRGPNDPDYAVSSGSALAFDGRRFRYLQLPLQRVSGFGRASYEVTDALTLSLQGLYTHTRTGVQLNPAGVPGSTGISAVPVTNPFIPSDFRTILASRANPTATFNIDLRPDAVGPRIQRYTYNTFQLVAAAEGRFGVGDWTYSLSGSYGRNDIDLLQRNYVSRTRVNALVRAADGGASLCTGGYNPFADQPISDSCIRYQSPDLYSSTTLIQKVAEATVQGGLFNLPGGTVRASIGAGYRSDTYDNVADPLVAAGDIFAAGGQTFRGQINTKELFGELVVPILNDVPFFKSLELDLAYRYSDYSTVGGVHTYKADGSWELVRGVRFRGGYERAIRAPNIGEIFQPQTPALTIIGLAGPAGAGDPCDINGAYRRASNAAQVRSLCLGSGVPSSVIDTFTFGPQSINVVKGGNPALRQETADTYSLGIVLAPDLGTSLLDRFSVSVDFYSIKVEDAVGTITSNISLPRCFNADGVSNPGYAPSNFFCSLITRDPGTGAIADAQELTFNLGGFRTSGIDFQTTWRTQIGDDAGSLSFNLVGTYLRSFKIQSLPADPFRDYAGTIGNGQIDPVAISRPHWKGVADVTYNLGGLRAGFRWRYIGAMDNASNVGTTGTARGVGATSYFDLNLGYRVSPRFEIWGTVANLGDRTPPTYPSQGSTDFATYDSIGRKFTIGVRTRF